MPKSKYLPEFRDRVSQEYIDGVGSIHFPDDKNGIGYSTLRGWIKVYNANREVKDYDPKHEELLKGLWRYGSESVFEGCWK